MRFATLWVGQRELAAAFTPGRGWLPLRHIDPLLDGDLLTLVRRGYDRQTLDALGKRAAEQPETAFIADDQAVFAPPYRSPRKIWGIGLNYREHAADLSEDVPADPASFIKGDHTIIGYGEDITLPRQSRRVTSEAELGIVIGRECYEVSPAEALEYVFGYCPILDQTAEDILQQNPRYLTRSKNFPSFFSFGPEVVTLDDLLAGFDRIEDVPVTTVRAARGGPDASEERHNVVANMTTGPADLISFHSQCMPLYPGDIISTGTPGALVIRDGDVMEARVGNLRILRNQVRGRPA
jgi:2-keto-4-pentenoate hydratase/2-oxohepta-3-ene-1,7-dioic acid hydratase in catechol pathway